MTKRRVLVSGGAGVTGGYTIRALASADLTVRALLRSDDDRAARLRSQGVEIAIGDLLDIDTVAAAMVGVDAAYFVYPIVPGLIDASAYFAQAAKEAKLSAVVNMSQISARRDSLSHQARDHWVSERIFDWSGLSVTHLRPTFFAEWLTYPRIREDIAGGIMHLPFGNGRHAPIAAEDQGRVIAAILMNPVPHRGRTYELFGPIEMDQYGVAAAVSEALGRTIVYDPITVEQFRDRLTRFGLLSQAIQHLCAVAVDFQNGRFAGSNDVVQQITGAPAMTVQAFVRAHLKDFGGPMKTAA